MHPIPQCCTFREPVPPPESIPSIPGIPELCRARIPSDSEIKISYNGTVCTVKRDGRPGGVQMITFTEKLMNLKYELLMAYMSRDIQFLSSVLIECRNMIICEIFISTFNIIIRFVRKCVFKIEMSFIDTI